jgi:hypothetical protein
MYFTVRERFELLRSSSDGQVKENFGGNILHRRIDAGIGDYIRKSKSVEDYKM